MNTEIKEIEMDKHCTHLNGYALGFEDARLQMCDRLNSLINLKSEYDRAFCILRQEGVTKEETAKLSTALSLLLASHKKEILMLKMKEANVDDSKYSELIMEIKQRHPTESCHETALRYIRQAETSDNQCVEQADQCIKESDDCE